jgi:DNA-binding PadR family transcriptional regulator
MSSGNEEVPPVNGRINATAASLLGLLADAAPMTGWELCRAAEARLANFWSLTRSQVYRELAAMADAGLVEAGNRGPRDRHPYAITTAGRQAFSDYINADPATEAIRYPLLLTLAFGDHVEPAAMNRILTDQRELHRQRLEHYEHASESAPDSAHPDPWALATLRFGILHEQATLAWFDQLPQLLPAAETPTATTRRPHQRASE